MLSGKKKNNNNNNNNNTNACKYFSASKVGKEPKLGISSKKEKNVRW